MVTANYKAHLGTSSTAQAFSRNQRRAAFGVDGGGTKKWLLAYESNGDVWMTMYCENANGTVLIPETRLNYIQGAAFNPTVVSVDTSKALIGWLENTGSKIEFHLQTLKFDNHSGYWGWTFPSPQTRNTTHRIVNDFIDGFGVADNPLASSRPTLSVVRTGTTYSIFYTYEKSGGIVAGKINVSSSQELNYGSVVSHKAVTTEISSYPAIAAMDSANVFIYYTTGGYATLKLYEYKYNSGITQTVPLASGDATISSIQASVNRIMCTRTLVVDAYNSSSGAYYGQTVNYYYAGVPVYGYYPPSLRTKYLSVNQSSVMSVDMNHTTSQHTPILLTMRTAPSNSWVRYRQQLNGAQSSGTIGSTFFGMWLREKAYSGNDSVITVVNNSTSPAAIQRYPSSGGGLQKNLSEETIVTTTKAVRIWKDAKGIEYLSKFNFGTLPVEILREKEKGNILCAVKLSNIPTTGSLISQIDSLIIPLQMDVEREGTIIRSQAASKWKQLSSKNIPDLIAGDILYLRVANQRVDACWGYEEIEIVDSELSKRNENGVLSENLIPSEFSVGVYPNPFNPSTIFKINLPEASNVHLAVYNMLGQKVATIVDEEIQAGYNEFHFNGGKLSSGIYLYHAEAGKKISSGKIMLLK